MNKKALAWVASAVFMLATGISHVSAQDMDRPAAILSQEQLDQLLAPVALYPDSLLAQVFMAATYPLEVVQAARFIDSRPGLQGEPLARAIAPMPWDPSVKSLAQFPSVLAMMNDQLDWTQRLGDAFLSQQANVMDTVQNLRMKAEIAGNLQSTSQQRIVEQDQVIMIEPVDPQIIYVPYYNPVVVYGSWWWPQRPPVYWMPPPRYRPPGYNMAINAGIAFGAGVGIARWGYNEARPDWRQHHVLVNHVRINDTHASKVTIDRQPVIWQHARRPGQNARRPDVGNVIRPNNPAPGNHAPQLANPATRQPSRPAAQPQQRPEHNEWNHNGRKEPMEQRRPPSAQATMPAQPAPPVRPNRPEAQHRPRQAGAAPPMRQERPQQRVQHEAPRPVQQAAPQPRPPIQAAPRQEHREAARPDARPKND